MSVTDFEKYPEMKVFMHHIYEFKKGVRRLVLCTMSLSCAHIMVERLKDQDIEYAMQVVSPQKVNLYFGMPACMRVVGTFIGRPLNELSPEEDFILGAMLGYDITQQCERYSQRKTRCKNVA